jgi:benzoate transport
MSLSAQNLPITQLQYTVLLICFLMNMLDGMDVMVISYTAPSITKAWAISPEALGIVFSTGLLGMAIGAMFLAPRADIIGRRAMILICAAVMGLTVFLTQFAQNVEHLIFFRLISGIGIGGMLASTATLAAEYAPAKTKDFWVSFAMSGYPIGAVLSGLVAAEVIPKQGWHMMFSIAGIATAVTLPLIYLFLSESLDFLLKSQPQNALERANSILSQINQPTLAALPIVDNNVSKASVGALLSEDRKIPTLQLWVAIFLAFATLYFLTMWIPKLASSAGLSPKLAIYAGTVFNLGAFFGITLQGYLSSQIGLRRIITYYFVGTAVLMGIFGFFTGSSMILALFGLIGFGIQGGFIGLYAVAARLYPTQVRTTGVGWAIGLGRVGAIVGPIVGGLLIGAGLSMTANFMVFVVPTLISGIVTLLIRSQDVS